MTVFIIPKPMTEVPRKGKKYYVPTLSSNYHMRNEWEGDDVDKKFLKEGLCFHTPEDATIAAHPMRAALPMYEALEFARDQFERCALHQKSEGNNNSSMQFLECAAKCEDAMIKARGGL